MIGKKLKEIIGKKGRKDLDSVAKEIGVTVSALYTAFKTDRVPSQKVLDYIHLKYPNLNFNWWFYDQGSKWLDETEKVEGEILKQELVENKPARIQEPPNDDVIFTDPEILALLEEEKLLKEQIKNVLQQKVSQMRNRLYMFQSELKNQNLSELGKHKRFTNETVLRSLSLFPQQLGVA